MLASPAPFPFAGSKAFLKDSADPVTIIRLNADRTALVRRDPRPGEIPHRDASGNREEPLANLFESADDAAKAGLLIPTPRRKAQSRREAPQGRPAARSRSGAAGNREADKALDGAAQGQGS